MHESAETAASCEFTLWESWARTDAADVALELERFDVAESDARAALTIAWENGDRRIVVWALILLARSALGRGELERAGRLWAAADAENEESRILANDDDVQRVAAPLRTFDAPAFTDALAMGRAAPLEAAVALALSRSGGA